MSPRRRTTEPSIKVDDLVALKDRLATKSTDYLRTSKAYKSRCTEGMVIQLTSQAKVLDMVQGWVQELIDGNQADTAAATPAKPEPVAKAGTEDPAMPETDVGPSPPESELSDQGQGQVDLSGMRQDH